MIGNVGAARRALIFRAMEWLISRLLLGMALIARRTGDIHELRHILAEMEAGESVDCGPGCSLRRAPCRLGGRETR